jgi:hypothetical protein
MGDGFNCGKMEMEEFEHEYLGNILSYFIFCILYHLTVNHIE